MSHTDGGGPKVCGGIAREFYSAVGQRSFRPSEAEAWFVQQLRDAGVDVRRRCYLDRARMTGDAAGGYRITEVRMEDGLSVVADQFIDATYEGDLMAAAGVPFTVGRESSDRYGESLAGVRLPGTGGHNFPVRHPIDPFVVAGDPSSGLIPGVGPAVGRQYMDDVGEADDSVQAYCFRMRLVDDPDRRPFPKPEGYDAARYELLARLFASGAEPAARFGIDTNNHHLFDGASFIDHVGGADDWPRADYATRETIFQDHVRHQTGVMWFLANDPRVPEDFRRYVGTFGLPRDEFESTGGWPHELYVREARRMVGPYVMTEANCRGEVVAEDPIALASYNMDSHHCRVVVLGESDDPEARVANEGNFEVGVDPYPVSYRSITPPRDRVTNLLVPVALSASHVAFGSIRMEPVFMAMGQSAATAACLAIDADTPVQDVDYPTLRRRLERDGQVLSHDGPKRHGRRPVLRRDAASMPGVVVDDADAELAGPWIASNHAGPFVGTGYRHDNHAFKGDATATFTAELDPGEYAIRLHYRDHPNRATNVPVVVRHADGSRLITVDQTRPATTIGRFRFDDAASVTITNLNTDGVVVIDAVSFEPPSTISTDNHAAR